MEKTDIVISYIVSVMVKAESEKEEKQMEAKLKRTNYMSFSGMIISDFQDGYTAYGEKYYVSEIEMKRLSGKADRIPIIVPEKLINDTEDYIEKYICALGQYRSRNCYDGQKRRLELYISVRDFSIKMNEDGQADNNYIFLDGYLCKKPIYRLTPLGRAITDLLVAVNRPNGRSDYIPCICWGRTACLAASLSVGSHVGIVGRVQSREYTKRQRDRKPETRIAYEVSVSKLRIAN